MLLESTTVVHKESTAFFQEPLSPAERKSASLSPRTSSKDSSSSLAPIQIETSPASSVAKREESPPATPPSSKRAKIMASKEDDTAGLVEIKPQPRETSPGEERTTRRRKTPERKATGLRQNVDESVVDTPQEVESRRKRTPERRSPARLQRSEEESVRKTPERKSPARQTRNEEELARKTPERKSPARHQKGEEESTTETYERRSPSRKMRKLDEDSHEEGVEETSSGREVSPMRTRRKTPERKSPARKASKTSTGSLSVITTEPSGEGEERFEAAEIVMKSVEEAETEISQEVSVRRRSTRLNTPDRSAVDVAGAKSSRGRKQREASPLKDIESESSSKEQKFTSAEKVLGDMEEPEALEEVPVRRRSTRLNTPDLCVAEPARGKSPTPTRVARQRGETPQRQHRQEESSSKEEEEAPIPSRQSSRKIQSSRQVSGVREITEDNLKQQDKEMESPEDVEEAHSKTKTLAHSQRSSRRETKTPDGLMKEDIEEPTSTRRSTRKTKTPDRVATEDRVRPSLRSTRQSKTPDTILEESPDPSESHNLRRSRRQSKTPDRQPVKGNVEPLTPTRRSRRQHKSPDALNTDEIEPMSGSSSPKRPGKDAFPEPATPPKMASKMKKPEEDDSKVEAPRTSTRRSPARKAPVAVTEDTEEISAASARRSTRRAKSPERLNTDQIQPVSPQDLPARSVLSHVTCLKAQACVNHQKCWKYYILHHGPH